MARKPLGAQITSVVRIPVADSVSQIGFARFGGIAREGAGQDTLVLSGGGMVLRLEAGATIQEEKTSSRSETVSRQRRKYSLRSIFQVWRWKATSAPLKCCHAVRIGAGDQFVNRAVSSTADSESMRKAALLDGDDFDNGRSASKEKLQAACVGWRIEMTVGDAIGPFISQQVCCREVHPSRKFTARSQATGSGQ